MKKVLIVLTSLFMFFLRLSPAVEIKEYTQDDTNDTYISYKDLSNEEKTDINDVNWTTVSNPGSASIVP